MKKTLLALAVLSVSTISNADTKNFAGFNIGLGLDATSTTFKTSSSFSQTYENDSVYVDKLNESNQFGSKQKLIPSLSFGYNLPINNKFLLGVEAKYDLTKGPKSNSNSSIGTDIDGVNVATLGIGQSVQQKSHWSLALKPGYTLSDNVLVYAKLAYHKAKSVHSDSISFSVEGDTVTDSFSQTIKQNGIGFGGGIEYNITKSLFVRAEVEQIRYKSKNLNEAMPSTGASLGLIYGSINGDVLGSGTGNTNIKPNVTVGGITLGYRF